MRTREEIVRGIGTLVETKGPNVVEKVLQMEILDVLLDIRELLIKANEKHE